MYYALPVARPEGLTLTEEGCCTSESKERWGETCYIQAVEYVYTNRDYLAGITVP